MRYFANLIISIWTFFSLIFNSYLLGIPQLRFSSDIYYLRSAFSLGNSDNEAQSKWLNLLVESLNTKTTQINFFFHNLAHPI
jgi:hypothetical protein